MDDNVKIWRLNNQIRNLEKVKKIVEEHHIDIKQVNVKVLLPYLEGVSLEEDETLQNMWANLFVNYIDVSVNLASNVYPSVLSQISTQEVRILTELKSNHRELAVDRSRHHRLGHNSNDAANLVRLGLIKARESLGELNRELDHLTTPNTQYFCLSYFGLGFFKACSPRNN